MHPKPTARHALAALTAVAALIALPAAAIADKPEDRTPLTAEVRAELAELSLLAEDTTRAGDAREAVRAVTEGDDLTAELQRLRRRIKDRNAVEQIARPRVLMAARLAAETGGAAPLRMACTDDAVAACQGIVWLADEAGDVVAHARFRIPAGEARRVRVRMHERVRLEERLVATAAVRDESEAIWTNTRQIAPA